MKSTILGFLLVSSVNSFNVTYKGEVTTSEEVLKNAPSNAACGGLRFATGLALATASPFIFVETLFNGGYIERSINSIKRPCVVKDHLLSLNPETRNKRSLIEFNGEPDMIINTPTVTKIHMKPEDDKLNIKVISLLWTLAFAAISGITGIYCVALSYIISHYRHQNEEESEETTV